MPDIYANYTRLTWDSVHAGDTVYIDNYENGKYPDASPAISGPYIVSDVKYRRLTMTWGKLSTFMHYPDNLLGCDLPVPYEQYP